ATIVAEPEYLAEALLYYINDGCLGELRPGEDEKGEIRNAVTCPENLLQNGLMSDAEVVHQNSSLKIG
ncbi:hypothetical protein ACC754_44540, partial [Rhizobium johnstonii]